MAKRRSQHVARGVWGGGEGEARCGRASSPNERHRGGMAAGLARPEGPATEVVELLAEEPHGHELANAERRRRRG